MKSRKWSYISNESGFTLMEMLVVIVIVGILGAIAAPSWMAFLSRQKMNSVRGELMSVMREAQVQAQSQRQTIEVTFPDIGALPPGASPLAVSVKKAADSGSGEETILGGGEVADTYHLVADAPVSIQFDHDGRVVTGDDIDTPFVIEVIDSNAPPSSQKSCVVVTTVLGGLTPANNDLCDTF